MRRCALALVSVLALAGCAAPYDDDGEAPWMGELGLGAAPAADATPVVVDTDLAGDDLVALAFLLRHPSAKVEAVTIAGTGLVGCDPGVDLVADLFTALGEDPVPVACGREEAGPGATEWPQEWRDQAATGTGIPRDDSTWEPTTEPAADLIGRLAGDVDGLVVVALGPMTNLADLSGSDPEAYGRLAGVHSMAGSVEGPLVDGIAEWNVAADPEAFARVLASDAPLTVVPEDAIPDGTPDAVATAPVVGLVVMAIDYPKWWDTATVAALFADAVEVDQGTWVLDKTEPGRLLREGEGPVRVVRELDAAALDAELEQAFQAD